MSRASDGGDLGGARVTQVPEPLMGGDKAFQTPATVGLRRCGPAAKDSSKNSKEIVRRLEVADITRVVESN